MIKKTSALTYPEWAGKPIYQESEGWPVILEFSPSEFDTKTGLTDMSHRPKAMMHGIGDAGVPHVKPGQAIWNGQAYIAGIKTGEALIFDLTGPSKPQWPSADHTDLTDALVLLALWGDTAKDVMHRMVAVDIEQPGRPEPFFLTTRCHSIILHVLNCKTRIPVFLLSCIRSHGQNLLNTALESGRHLGLRPAGLTIFSQKSEHGIRA